MIRKAIYMTTIRPQVHKLFSNAEINDTANKSSTDVGFSQLQLANGN